MIEIHQITTVWQLYKSKGAATGCNALDAATYIVSHSKGHSADDVAAALNVDLRWLSETVRIYAGVSLKQFILQWRLYQALDLLDKPELSIEEVYGKCGFVAERHFATSFSRAFGVSPHVYRNDATQHHPLYNANTPKARQEQVEKVKQLKARYENAMFE